MNKTSQAVLAALMLSGASATKLQYRPTAGSVPWGGAAARPEWDTPPYPVNYYIPNFGADHNILTTMNSLRIAEKSNGKALKASFAQNDITDMRMPDLGADEDVKFAQASINESQKETGQQLKGVNFAQNNVQYAQSLGQDSEIADSVGSLNLAEKKIGHSLTTQVTAADVNYNQKWQQLGQDEDISMAQANIAETEKMYGKFVPVKDFDGLWKVGKPDQQYVQLEVESDPICSSAGCGQYSHPPSKEVTYPQDYGVPHFGMDRDIMGSLDNMKVAETVVGHQWKGIDGAKYANPAKAVNYNFIPKIDSDIIDSQAHLAATENVLKHTYTLS